MKTISKILAFVITLTLTITIFYAFGMNTSAATVDSGTCGDNLTWALDDEGTLTISGTGDMEYYYFFYGSPWHDNDNIKNVVIDNGVTSIGRYAFYGCSSLTSITIPEGVTSIGDDAFYNCTSLTSVTIPEGVTNIGSYAFSNCTSITGITIPNSVTSIGEKAFENWTSLTKINWNVKNCANFRYDSKIFYNAGTSSNGISVIFSDMVETIPAYLFYESESSHSPNIKSVTIGKNVTSIGWRAFYGCSSLTSITIPEGVTSIWYDAFYNCTNLTKINWNAKNCEEFFNTSNTFYNAGTSSNGISVIFGDMVETIPAYLFYVSESSHSPNIKSVTIGNSVISIGEAAFSNCTSLTSVKFGTNSKLTSIGASAFYNCRSLTSITITNGVTSIGNSAFRGCTSLTSITIPDGVTSIGDYAFEDCTSLTSITIPNSVTSIGREAFSGCSSINSITLPFVGDKIHKATDTYQYPFGYIFGVTQYTDETKQYYIGSSLNSIEFSYYRIPSSLKSVTITGGSIPYGAFYNCSNLTNITLGKNVKDIGNNAFYNCAGLTSIIIPDSVTSIGAYAFSGCSSLTNIQIGKGITDFQKTGLAGSSLEKLEKITLSSNNTTFATVDGVLFSKGLTIIYYYPAGKTGTEYTVPAGVQRVYKGCFQTSKLTKITMPNGLQNIGDNAFRNCKSLKTVTIPKSLTYIGAYAFNYDSIDDVYYGGSSSDKQNITIGENNSALQSAIWHYNTVIKDVPATPDKPATHTHSYKSSVTTKATCTKAGVMTYVCSCGNSNTKAIPATGHKDANADKVCDVCGAKITTLNAKINVASAKSVDYKAQVTIKATASGVPTGYSLAMYVNGKQVAKGSNTEVSYTVGQATSDINYTVKVIDAKGNVQKDSANKDLAKDGGKITVNSSFFAKIIAFFKGLFGMLPKVDVKP